MYDRIRSISASFCIGMSDRGADLEHQSIIFDIGLDGNYISQRINEMNSLAANKIDRGDYRSTDIN